MTYRAPTLADVIATLDVERIDDHHFRAIQLDNAATSSAAISPDRR